MEKLNKKIVQWHYRKTREIPEKWNMLPLGKLCTVRKKAETNSNLYVGLENVGSGNNRLDSRSHVANFTSTKNVFLKGDILYGKLRPLLNKVWLAGESGYCSTDILPLTPNDKILGEILQFVLSGHDFHWYAVGMSAGTKMPRVNWSDMKNFLVIFPPLPEQQKIAVILSNLDLLLEQTDKIIEKLVDLQRVLMKQLLTKGIGHTKFKKVNWYFGKKIEIPDDWEVVTISKLGKIVTGNTPKTSIPEFYDGEYLWASPADLGSRKYVESTISTLSAKGFQKSRIIPAKSILVVCIGSTIGKIGMSIKDMSTNQQINTIIPKICNNEFIYYLMVFNQQIIQNFSNNAAVPILNKTDFGSIKICKPKDILEQQKIAAILSNIDSQLQIYVDYKSQLENIKKGFVQNLLTGNIRVKV